MKQEQHLKTSLGRARRQQQSPRIISAESRDANAAKLLQELQWQQFELEAQYAELQRIQAERQAALERYTRFYDCAPVGYFTLRQDGGIAQLNVAAAKMLGSERRQLLDKRFGLFVEPGDRAIFNDFLDGVFAGEEKECCNVALRHPDSIEPPIYAHLEAVQRESGLTCNVVAVDVSERKRAELLLEDYRAELEATVAARTSELSAANQELEGFVYAASHDMKAPLARLGSLSAMLAARFRDQLEGDGLFMLELIQQNAQRLNALVDDLLAHTQIRQQPLQVRPVDVPGLTQIVLQELAEDIRQVGADVWLDFQDDLSVEADAFGLRQILSNLIHNALKFSAQATPPVVEIGGRTEGEVCRLWVRDNGIGIDRRYHERIFEIFRRLHTYAEYPGSGVGLALVKKAIERMGGKVRVESELGQGATFHLEWPRAMLP